VSAAAATVASKVAKASVNSAREKRGGVTVSN
jgi:hypothetical protein